jgi:hypothetical protein
MTGDKKGILGRIKLQDLLKKMKSLKFGLNTTVVAVEIGNDWLKIVQKTRARNGKVVYVIDISKLAQIKDSVSSAISRYLKI